MFEECWRLPGSRGLVPDISIAAVYRVEPGSVPGDERLEVKYGRENNPTVLVLESVLNCMEGARRGLAFNTGMSAIATLLHTARSRRARLTLSRLVYGTTYELARRLYHEIPEKLRIAGPPWDELLSLVDRSDMVLVETIGNPTLRVPPIDVLARECSKRGCMLVVDNTFASPAGYRPIPGGASVVVESLTKYIGGHNDLLGGYIGVDSDSLHKELWGWRKMLGTIIQPLEAYLAYRGARTLESRFSRVSETAARIAETLAGRGDLKVLYPCLPDSPDYENARRLLRGGCGGVLSIDLGSGERAVRFLKSLRVARTAPSLGSVDTLASHPYTSSHRWVPESEKERLGITPGLVRISVGLEDVQVILNDITGALEKASQ